MLVTREIYKVKTNTWKIHPSDGYDLKFKTLKEAKEYLRQAYSLWYVKRVKPGLYVMASEALE